MNVGVYTLASGGVAAQTQLEATAHNLANSQTAGYKAERVVFDTAPLQNFPRPIRTLVAAQTVPQVVEATVEGDFSQGVVDVTGNPYDVAITGDGFFAVTTPRGERYTRQGTFTVDAEGFVTTSQGFRVQGRNGDISVGSESGRLEIADDGTVSIDGDITDQLRVVSFGEHPKLVPEGNALYAAGSGGTAAATALEPGQINVTQGAIERANVNAISGLVGLIEVARGYEAYMKAISQLDEVAQRSIQEVGRVG